jgi:type I restriction enzyme S subunit
MMFRPDQSKVDPKFLFYQLSSPPFHEDQVLCSMTGTTSRHVNIKNLRDMKIILPPLPEQRRIVAHLDSLQAKVDEVKRLQAETEREMVALVPAVLAKAFGESE